MKTLIAVSAFTLGLCGAAAAETRQLSDFTRVSAQAGTQVDVTIGANFSVEVTGPDAARIETRVLGGELSVRPLRDRWHWGRRDARVLVTMPRVEGLEASSGAHLTARGVAAGDLDLEASSGAGLEVAGACGDLTAAASSGAVVGAADLRCESGAVEASSGARASVNVSGRLSVDASSGGDVYASGDPVMGDISLSSGGSLHRN